MRENDIYALIAGAFLVFVLGWMFGSMQGETVGFWNGRDREREYQKWLKRQDNINAADIG